MIPLVIGAMMLQMQAPQRPMPVPFRVGEAFEYGGKWKFFSVGGITMKVAGIDTVRGVPSWHFTLAMQVNFTFYHQHTELASWTGIDDFTSRRFVHVVDDRHDDFTIFPDSGFYRNVNDTTRHKTPHDALDDLAFIYFLRTIPLKAGGHYEFNRYYREEHNPVIVDVVGRELVDMPDGTRSPCWILHPIVDEPHGMFDRDHDARIWITDDGRRIPVQIRSSYPVAGAITLKLRAVTMPFTRAG